MHRFPKIAYLQVTSISDVPLVNAVLFAKVRLLEGGSFEDATERVDVSNHGASFSHSAAMMSASASRVTSGLSQIKSSLSGIAGSLGPIAGAMAAAFSVSAIKSAADDMMNLDGRLRTVTQAEQERYELEDKLYAMAQKDRQSLNSMGDLYYKVARGAQRFGVSQEDSLRVTDVVSKALTVGGASAQEVADRVQETWAALK